MDYRQLARTVQSAIRALKVAVDDLMDEDEKSAVEMILEAEAKLASIKASIKADA